MAFRVYQQQVGSAGIGGYRQHIVDDRAAAAAQLNKGLEKLGQGAQQVRDVQDTAVLQDRFTKLQQAKQRLLDHPETGFVNQKGENALSARETVVTSFDGTAKELVDGLNQRQQTQFQRLLDHERLSFVDSVDRHVAQQSDVLAEQKLDGALSAASSSAAAAAARGELDKVPEAIGLGEGALRLRARAAGWNTAFAAQKGKEFATQSHLGVLDTLMERGQTSAAQQYLDTHRGDMDAGMLAKSNVEKTLRGMSDADAGARLARKYVTGSVADVVRPWDRTGTRIPHIDATRAFAELEKLEADGTIPERVKLAAREHTEALVRSSEATWKTALDDVYARAITKLAGNGWKLSDLAQEKHFLLDDDVRGGQVWDAIIAHRNNVLREKAGAPANADQRSAMVQFLVTLPENQSRYLSGDADAYKSFMSDWGAKLAPTDLEQAAGYIARAGVGAAKPDQTLPGYAVARIKQVGDSAGLWGGKGPKSEEENNIYLFIYDGLLKKQAELKREGKPLDDEAVKTVLNELAAKGRVVGSSMFLPDDVVTRAEYQTNPDYADKPFEEEIPEATREGIREKLRAGGRPVTEDWVRWMWRDAHGTPLEQNPLPRATPASEQSSEIKTMRESYR